MKNRHLLAALCIALILALACAPRVAMRKPAYDYAKMDKETAEVHKKIEAFINTCVQEKEPLPLARGVRIDTLILRPEAKTSSST